MKFPTWKGFEFEVHGSLLDQMIDLSTPMGIAYERCIDFYKDFHVHDRLMWVFPRDSTIMDVCTVHPKKKYSIHSKNFLSIPANVEHDDESKSSLYDTFALFPSVELLEQASFDKIASCQNIFSRTPWLDQLLSEYFSRRIIENLKNVTFFEEEITREIGRIITGKKQKRHEKLDVLIPSFERTIRFIEANLFTDLNLDFISHNVGSSPSTLLRQFKKYVKQTPYQYIFNRRLEEAKRLLKTEKYPVGEVAILVGYSNFGAFTDAFKKKYSKLPSEI